MRKKKYVVVGGVVKSKNDKSFHYISPYRLAKLYRINPYSPDVVLINDIQEFEIKVRGLDINKCVFLFPKGDGKYNLLNTKRGLV